MMLSDDQLMALTYHAISVAQKAGKFIMTADRSQLSMSHKNTGSSLSSQVVTEVDRHCDRLIQDALQETCEQFGFAILSEENAHIQERQATNRFTQKYFWCVDPLDGTLPFIESTSGFAVSIALVSNAGVPVIGVVYDPVSQTTYHAIRQGGAFKSHKPISIPLHQAHQDSVKPVLQVYGDLSFKEAPVYAEALNILERAVTTQGCSHFEEHYGRGAVMNACALLEHAFGCYFKLPKPRPGGGCLWDFAASACIVHEAGGWVSDYYGQPLALNGAGSLFMNERGILFASNQTLASALIKCA